MQRYKSIERHVQVITFHKSPFKHPLYTVEVLGIMYVGKSKYIFYRKEHIHQSSNFLKAKAALHRVGNKLKCPYIENIFHNTILNKSHDRIISRHYVRLYNKNKLWRHLWENIKTPIIRLKNLVQRRKSRKK